MRTIMFKESVSNQNALHFVEQCSAPDVAKRQRQTDTERGEIQRHRYASQGNIDLQGKEHDLKMERRITK